MKIYVALCMALALSSSSFSYAAFAAPFGDEADISFAKQLWASLKAAEFVGPKRINVRPFEGTEPHGSIQQVLGKSLKVGARTGQVLVKANHVGEEASVATVYDNPNRFLRAYTVMFKREEGYDPENKNWFWVKYDKDGVLAKTPTGIPLAGRVAKGSEKGCLYCHGASGGEDFQTLTEK